MRFQTKQRTGVVSFGSIVNEFVQITGTLAEPRVEISAERAARSGFFAAVTGGLSLLAGDMFVRITAKDACPDLAVLLAGDAAQDADTGSERP